MAEQSETEDGDGAVVWGSAYPPSINAGIPKLGELPAGWSRLRMKDMLDVIERPVKLVDSQTYQLVTAKRSRGGIVSRGTLRGDEIKVKQQFEVRSGDFILSNRQIAHGGCGIVPPELDGAVVSGEYTVLHPKPMLDLRFLRYLSHSTYFQQICFHSGVGVHVEKLVFRLHDWLNWKIDIPSLPEQQRIAEILGDFERAIEATDSLIAAKQQRKRITMDRVWRSIGGEGERSLAEIIEIKRAQIGPREIKENSLISDLYSYEAFDAGSTPSSLKDVEVQSAKFLLDEPCVLFGKLNPRIPRVWLAKIFEGTQAVASTEFWPCLPNKAVSHEYVQAIFSADWFLNRPEIQPSSTTKSHQRVDREAFLSVPVPVPSKNVQQLVGALNASLQFEIEQRKLHGDLLRQQSRGLMQKLLAGDRKHRSLVMEEVAV